MIILRFGASLVAQLVEKLPAMQETIGLIPGLGRSPGGGHGNPLKYSCLGNPHGQRSLVRYSPWGHKELETTEWLSTAQDSTAQAVVVVKNPPANAQDLGSIPGSGRYPGGGHGYPLQYSCLENPMNRGAWWAIVYRVADSDITEAI